MDRRLATLLVLGAIWLGAMALSVLSLMAEPTGDGFVRGMNRITGFVGWQLAASIVALSLWLTAGPWPKGGWLRRLAHVPGWWAVLLLVLIVAWIAINLIATGLDAPELVGVPGPVTVPVD